MSQKQELESKLEEVQNKLDEALADKHRLDHEDRKFGRELDDSRQRFKVMDEEVRKHQQNLDRLGNVDKGNPLARFGKDVPAIANAFKAAEKSFPKGKAPIGPVGAFIKIRGCRLLDCSHRRTVVSDFSTAQNKQHSQHQHLLKPLLIQYKI